MAASMTVDTENNKYIFTDTLTHNNYNVVFSTINTFLDKNIGVELTVNAGTLNLPTFTNTNISTYFNEGTSSSNSISISPRVTNTAGFIQEHGSSSPLLGNTAYYTIKTTTVSFSGGSLGNKTATIKTKNNIVTNTSTNNSGISIVLQGTASYSASTYSNTAGWLAAHSGTSTGTGISTQTWDGTTYYIDSVTVGSGKTFGVTNSGTTTVTSGSTSAGTVTIVAKKTASDSSNTTANIITNGLWQQATIKSPNTTATIGNPTFVSDSSNTNYQKFTITASGTIAKPTVNPAGYVNGDDTIGTRQTGTISGTKVLNRVTVGTTISSGTSGTVKPVIARTAKPSDDTWVDAASGAVTTTKPTSGVYIRVDAAAVAKSIGVKGTVTSAGYGTTTAGQYAQAAEQSITAGSSAADSAYVPITTTTVSFTAGALNNKSATIKTQTNVVANDTNNSGISIVLQGTAGCSSSTYTNTAGWLDAHSGTTTNTAISKQTWNGTTYYINSVSVIADKTFTVTSNAGTTNITNTGTTVVTSGSTSAGTVTIKAKVTASDSATTDQNVVTNGLWKSVTMAAANTAYYGRVTAAALTVTTSSTNDGMSTYFNTGTSSDKNVTITPKYTNTAGFKTALTTATNNGGTTYWKIKTTSVVQTNVTTVSGTTATRATATWGTGWVSSGSIAAATFAASGTSNVTYVDISNTTAAPVLTAGGALYINRGYVDNLKIDLAKLVPDSISGKIMATAPYILTGYAAFNGEGVAVSGTMAIYNGAYTVVTS